MLLGGYTVKAAEEIVQAEQSSHHAEKNSQCSSLPVPLDEFVSQHHYGRPSVCIILAM
jgi:hypothetical protein